MKSNLWMVAALAMFLLSTTVQAADRKGFPATGCKISSAYSGYARYIVYNNYGGVENTHPEKRISVVCPILRDNAGSSSPNFVRVTYWDRNPIDGAVGRLSCRLQANNIYGSFRLHWQTLSTPLRRATEGIFHFNRVRANSDDLTPVPYTMICWLPPAFYSSGKYRRSSIGSFLLEER